MAAPLTSDAAPRATQGGATPLVGVIANPRSHRNKGKEQTQGRAENVRVAVPRDHDLLVEELARFKQEGIELLVISGGDGTVRDVLTAGLGVFGEEWPVLAVLPKGKTNALTVDLDAPTPWTLDEAIAAYGEGRRIKRAPLSIAPKDNTDGTMLGFILGAGAFTLGIDKGQEAHRWGAFDSFAVGVTILWGLMGALAGTRRNPWRRGSEMEILTGSDRTPLPHSGEGEAGRRQVLFASTLERFPLGVKPFGDLRGGLKLAVLDPVKRRTMLRLPQMLLGRTFERNESKGFFQRSVDSFELTLTDKFILDGEAYPGGSFLVTQGPEITFVAP